MKEIIEIRDPQDYPQLLEVWERSVRATHHFLQEEDITYYKPLIINAFFPQVRLFGIKDYGNAYIAFLGLSPDKIEMLFIDPSMRGKGLGKTLLRFAVDELGIKKVDVNEENEQAVGFYMKMGFHTESRMEKDEQGKDYPILQMTL